MTSNVIHPELPPTACTAALQVPEGMFSIAKHPPLPMSIRPTAVFEPETAVKILCSDGQ